MTYEIYLYDVWGNEEDGYTINNVIPTGNFVEGDISEREFCEIFGLDSSDKLTIDDINDKLIFVYYNDKPYCELREVEENGNKMPALRK